MQSPDVGWAPSATANVPAVAPGRVLKPTYWVVALPVSAVGAIGYWLTPIHSVPLSWQVVQPLVTPAWICVVVGAGVMNLVPGAVAVALAAMSPVGMAALWH